MPGSLDAALDALEVDHDFLLQDDVFTQDVLDMWFGIKRNEAAEQRLRRAGSRAACPWNAR